MRRVSIDRIAAVRGLSSKMVCSQYYMRTYISLSAARRGRAPSPRAMLQYSSGVSGSSCISSFALLECTRFNSSASDVLKESEVASRLNELMESFGEARELIKDAMDSVGTTYFSDDCEDATKETEQTLKRWEDLKALLEKRGETEALESLVRQHELKMKQLTAELEDVKHAGGD